MNSLGLVDLIVFRVRRSIVLNVVDRVGDDQGRESYSLYKWACSLAEASAHTRGQTSWPTPGTAQRQDAALLFVGRKMEEPFHVVWRRRRITQDSFLRPWIWPRGYRGSRPQAEHKICPPPVWVSRLILAILSNLRLPMRTLSISPA
jgi:hypothetical protein